jgi:hypothetical protein
MPLATYFLDLAFSKASDTISVVLEAHLALCRCSNLAAIQYRYPKTPSHRSNVFPDQFDRNPLQHKATQ